MSLIWKISFGSIFLAREIFHAARYEKKRNLVFNLPMKFWGLINNKKILLGYLWSIITNQTSPPASSWWITKTDLPGEYFVGWGMQAASSWHLLPEKFFSFSFIKKLYFISWTQRYISYETKVLAAQKSGLSNKFSAVYF